MPRIDAAMTGCIMQTLGLDETRARALQHAYVRRYGATVAGLQRHHAVDPHHFLRQTHDVASLVSSVVRDGRLIQAVRRLAGPKFVLTNAPYVYARAVLRALGLAPHVAGLIAVEHMRWAGRWHAKPSRAMLRKVLARLRQPAARCVLVEDSVANLRAARHCRVRTVWVSAWIAPNPPVWQRPRAGQRGLDIQIRHVIELARTSLVKVFDEH